MDKDIRNHIINIMKSGVGGCKHQEMSEALKCLTCQMKMVRAQSEYNRLRKEHPEKFIRKIDDGYTPNEQNMGDMLEERIKQDSLYRKHLMLLVTGTQEEKIRENKREMSGYYEKHTGDQIRKIL